MCIQQSPKSAHLLCRGGGRFGDRFGDRPERERLPRRQSDENGGRGYGRGGFGRGDR